MFQKPFKIKSHSLVKKSDKKKLHDQLLYVNAGVTKDILEDLLPLKGDLGVTRVITHCNGEVLIYTNKKTPFFFTFQQTLYPTVYALWKHPDFLTTFTTHQFVFSRLQNGADLMLPGVMVPKPGLPHFSINQPCSVTLSGNRAAVAVGVTEMSREKIVERGVRSGKLLFVLHSYEDQLWQLGDKSSLPSIPAPIPEEEEDDVGQSDDNDINTLTEATGVKLMVDNTATEQLSNGEGGGIADKKGDGGHIADKKGDGDDDEGEVRDIYQHESIPECMDALLRVCFLVALKKFGRALKLPLLTNLFYKQFMMPCCPKDRHLQVKKSSQKKLGVFLAEMRDEGFIGLEESAKGVERISFVDLDHDCLRNFEVPSWQLNDVPKAEDDEDEDEEDWLSYNPPQFTPVFLTTAPVLDLLNSSQKRFAKGDVVTGAEAKEIVTAYVKANSLQEGRFVKLDVLLTRTLLNKSDYTEVLEWSVLMDVLCKKMSQGHLVEYHGRAPYVQKGNLEKIRFDVRQKASNKKVTEVWNLGFYGLDVMKLAAYIQRTVSCNAFVVHADDKAAKSDVLYVAGNQIHFIQQLLVDKYRLAAKNMNGLDKAVKKKKGK